LPSRSNVHQTHPLWEATIRSSHIGTTRRGALLLELVLTLVMLGIVLAVAIPSVRTMLDRMNVKGATHDVVLGLWAARNSATMRGTYTSFVVDSKSGRVRVVSGSDTLFYRDLATNRGVKVDVTRDSITYAPTGMGYGAANTRIVLSRGRRADTITTSRLGRVSF
jgi:Tfp pilus assembly protein FimT